MKRILLFITFLLVVTFNSFAQINTWDGSSSSNWSNPNNWSLNSVPSISNDAIIPTGSSVYIDINAVAKSIDLQGNSTLLITQNFAFSNTSTFQPNTTVNWSSGTISGGGTLTTKGVFNLNSQTNKFIIGNTTINNEGIITIDDIGDLYLNDGTINNQTTGLINFTSDGCDIYYQGTAGHILNN
jgi:hypothetical protein